MSILSSVFLVATVFTGLFAGKTAVGIPPRRHSLKLFGSAAAAVAVLTAVRYLTGLHVEPSLVYILLVPCLIWLLRVPVLQTVFILLFAWTYQIGIVYLAERNLFELAITKAGLGMDRFIEFVIELFIFMNHLLVIMACIRLKFCLIPQDIFKQAADGERGTRAFRPALLTNALLIVILNSFYQYTFADRMFFSGSYRLFITIWSLVLLFILLLYLKMSLLQKLKQEKFYLDQQYQKDLLSFFTVIRSERHDFNFHLTSLYGLLKSGRYGEAESYISDVVKQVQEVNELLPLAHPALSAMLNTLSEDAKRRDIEVHFTILDDLREVPLSVYDVNKVLGNLIQNAIEELASLPAERRQMSVEIAKEKRHFVFRVRNRTEADEGRIANMFSAGYSTKQTHEGIGLAGVQRIVEAYYGVIFPEMAGEWLTIHVRIPDNTEYY